MIEDTSCIEPIDRSELSHLYFDDWSGLYFMSTTEKIKKLIEEYNNKTIVEDLQDTERRVIF